MATHYRVPSWNPRPDDIMSYVQCKNLLLTKCEGRTGEHWPKVVAELTEGQYFLVQVLQPRASEVSTQGIY